MTKRIGSGLTDETGEAAGQITDHPADGLSKLISQFKQKDRIAALLTSYLEQCDDLETALWQLYTKRTVEKAVGAQLDGLGDIVGQPRGNLNDADYRHFIKTRIRVNISKGRAEELLQICRLLFGADNPTEIQDMPIADIYLTQPTQLTLPATFVNEFLQAAKAAGVKLHFIHFLESDRDDAFTYISSSQNPDDFPNSGYSHNGAGGAPYGSVLE